MRFLNSAVPEEELKDIRRHGRTGRPLGDESFLARLEGMVGRVLKPQKRGPKPKQLRIKLCVPGIPWGTTSRHSCDQNSLDQQSFLCITYARHSFVSFFSSHP